MLCSDRALLLFLSMYVKFSSAGYAESVFSSCTKRLVELLEFSLAWNTSVMTLTPVWCGLDFKQGLSVSPVDATRIGI